MIQWWWVWETCFLVMSVHERGTRNSKKEIFAMVGFALGRSMESVRSRYYSELKDLQNWNVEDGYATLIDMYRDFRADYFENAKVSNWPSFIALQPIPATRGKEIHGH